MSTPSTPPPLEMVDMMVSQLETVFATIQAPERVKKAAQEFIDSMKEWAKGDGQNGGR